MIVLQFWQFLRYILNTDSELPKYGARFLLFKKTTPDSCMIQTQVILDRTKLKLKKVVVSITLLQNSAVSVSDLLRYIIYEFLKCKSRSPKKQNQGCTKILRIFSGVHDYTLYDRLSNILRISMFQL